MVTSTMDLTFDYFVDDFLLPLLFPEDEEPSTEVITADSNMLYNQMKNMLATFTEKPVYYSEDGYYCITKVGAETMAHYRDLLVEHIPELKGRETDIDAALECWIIDLYL
jgi:hypothetical protein